MGALETESVAYSLARGRQLVGTAVGELETRARVGAGPGYVPLITHRNLFRKIQRNRPTAQCSSAAVGYAHVHLKVSARGIGRRCRTSVRGKCVIAQQQAGQQHSKFDQ